MINSKVKIQYLDINNENTEIIPVSDLFTKYVKKAVSEPDGSQNITFGEEDNIKVTDWTGWTQLLKFSKIPMNDEWMTLEAHFTGITVSKDCLIPVYDDMKSTRGFHGEIKYPFIIKEARDVIQTVDSLRIMNNELGSDMRKQFQWVRIGIMFKDPENSYGYKIFTKSNFYNANNFHLICNRYNDPDSIDIVRYK